MRSSRHHDDPGLYTIRCVNVVINSHDSVEGENAKPPSWKDIVINFAELTPSEIRKMGFPARFVAGHSFGTVAVEQRLYMRFLMERLKAAGVIFHQQRVANLASFVQTHRHAFDTFINCTGLGAGEILGTPGNTPLFASWFVPLNLCP